MTPKDALLKGLGRILRFAQDRVTQASPGAASASPPSVSTALRGHGWLGPILTTLILFIYIFALPALFGGL